MAISRFTDSPLQTSPSPSPSRTEIRQSQNFKSAEGNGIQAAFAKIASDHPPQGVKRSLFADYDAGESSEENIQAPHTLIASDRPPQGVKRSLFADYDAGESSEKNIQAPHTLIASDHPPQGVKRNLFADYDAEESSEENIQAPPTLIASDHPPQGVKRNLFADYDAGESSKKRGAVVGLDAAGKEAPVKSCRIMDVRDSQIVPIAFQKLNLPQPKIQETNANAPHEINLEELEEKFNSQLPKATPAAPQKAQRTRGRETPSLFKIASDNALNGTIQIQGQCVQLKLLSNQGSFMDVYTATAPNPIVPGQSNDTLVVKVFKQKRAAYSKVILKSWMTNSLNFYRATQNLAVPVAIIHNTTTATLEGCIIQDKIAHPANVLNPSHVKQARKFFMKSLQNQHVLFDLSPNNLFVAESGVMKLIDFPEEIPVDLLDDSWQDLCIHALENWARIYRATTRNADHKTTSDFLNSFTAGFEHYGYKPAWNDVIIASLFSLRN